jgi:hypothetical protein
MIECMSNETAIISAHTIFARKITELLVRYLQEVKYAETHKNECDILLLLNLVDYFVADVVTEAIEYYGKMSDLTSETGLSQVYSLIKLEWELLEVEHRVIDKSKIIPGDFLAQMNAVT